MSDDNIDSLLDRGEQLLCEHRLKEAQEHYIAVAARYPDNADALFALGLIAQESGDAREAADRFEDAIRKDRDHVEACVHLAALKIQFDPGDAADAMQLAKHASEIDPEYAECWVVMGKILNLDGKYPDAVDCFGEAIRIWPECAEAHFDLSFARRQSGQIEAALRACARGLELDPGRPGGWLGRAELEEILADAAAVETSSRRALELDPSSVGARLVLARSLLQQQRPADARCEFERITGSDAGNTDAWRGLAIACENAGSTSEAVDALRHALDQDAGDATTWFLLAMIEFRRGEMEQALASARRASDLDSGFEPSGVLQGDILRILGRLDESLAAFDRVIALNGNNLNAVSGKATVLDRQGLHGEANALLRPLLDAGHLDHKLAQAYAGLCQYDGDCDEAMEMLETLVSDESRTRTDQDSHDRHEAHNLLGKLYDRKGMFDLAFEHFTAANAYKKRTSPFDPEKHSGLVDGIISDYTRDRLRVLSSAGDRSRRPIFILGMPRSGTSLVEQILSSHPMVFGGGELQEMQLIAVDLDSRPGRNMVRPPRLDDLDEVSTGRAASRYLDAIGQVSDDAVHVSDKMPYNFFHLGLIQVLFPECRVIHCARDPLDTCLSTYFQNFSGYQGFAVDLGWIGHYYNDYSRLMRHWENELDLQVHTVRYEMLIADQEAETRSLLGYCGLEWHPGCMDFHKNSRVALTASYNQVRKPLYRSSARRWKNYEKHLAPLRQVLDQGEVR